MDTTRTRRQALVTLLATVTFEAAAVLALVALGRTPSARIDTADLGRWLDTTPLVDVAFALLRLVALALVAYLLATTVLYVLARLTRVPGLVRAVAPLTLPTVRRVADRAIAGSLVTATLVGGVPVSATALEATPPSAITVTESGALLPPGVRAPSDATAANPASVDGPERAAPIPTPRPAEPTSTTGTEAETRSPARPSPPIPTPSRSAATTEPETATDTRVSDVDGTVRSPGIPIPRPAPDTSPPSGTSTDEPAAEAPTDRPGAAAPGTAPARPVTPEVAAASAADANGPSTRVEADGEWVATRGDSLWHIAEHVVADSLGIDVDAVADHQVADYWHALVAANRDRVASGDVDVVAIGERIVLPPLGSD